MISSFFWLYRIPLPALLIRQTLSPAESLWYVKIIIITYFDGSRRCCVVEWMYLYNIIYIYYFLFVYNYWQSLMFTISQYVNFIILLLIFDKLCLHSFLSSRSQSRVWFRRRFGLSGTDFWYEVERWWDFPRYIKRVSH